MTHRARVAGPPPAGTRPLARIAERQLTRLVDQCPEAGVQLGIPSTNRGLPPADQDGIAARLAIFDDWRRSIDAIDEASLTPVERLDRAAFRQQHDLHRFVIGDLARWRHDPNCIGELGELLFIELARVAPDEERRFEGLLGRLEAVPGYLREVRSRLTVLDTVWADTAVRVCERADGLWTSIATAAADRASPGLASAVASAADAARDAVEVYRRFVADDAPRRDGLWVLGAERFDRLIELKRLGMDADAIRALGEQYREGLGLRRRELARSVCGADDVPHARAVARRPAPASFRSALDAIRDVTVRSRAFVAERGLAPLDEREELIVVETPSFLAPIIPFAAMIQAGVRDEIQRSIYLVTEPADGDLEALSLSRWAGIAVHEGYPGHHLQHTHAHRHASVYRNDPFAGFPRDASARYGLDLVEGWAHYTEELMKDHGFHDTPASRFAMVEDQLFRALRILVDVDLARGVMTMEAAASALVDEIGLGRAGAEAEVRRYTSSASYPLCYLLGKHRLEGLRDEVRARQGAGYDESAFHRALLDAGSVPLELARRHVLAASTGA